MDKAPYRALEFIENKSFKETFEAMKYVFHDIIGMIIPVSFNCLDNQNVANHFKRFKVLNFAMNVLKKLCRMQKLVQDEVRKSGIMPLIISVSEYIIEECKRNIELRSAHQDDVNNFLRYLSGLLINFVNGNRKN